VSVYERLEALNIALPKLTPPLRPARPGRCHSRPCRKIRHRSTLEAKSATNPV
jgi:hypothetical protein